MEDLKRLVKKMRERRGTGKEPDEEEIQLRLKLKSKKKDLSALGDDFGKIVCKALVDAPERKTDWVSRIKKKCRTCGGQAQLQCSVCMVSTYCSRDCQLKHWPEHKKRCYKYDYDPNFKMFEEEEEEEEKKSIA